MLLALEPTDNVVCGDGAAIEVTLGKGISVSDEMFVLSKFDIFSLLTMPTGEDVPG